MLKNRYGKLGQKSSKFLAAASEIWPVFAKLAKKWPVGKPELNRLWRDSNPQLHLGSIAI